MANIDNNKNFNKNLIDIVIYHNNCYDGFCSAFICYYYYKCNNINREITFIPASYYKEQPNIIDTNKNILICDFSYPYKIINDMINTFNSVLIIDHHKTAQADLENIPDENKIFDMNYSAAGLVWKYFFPNKQMPLLVQYIQDRDIWANKMEYCEEFVAWFYNMPMNFDLFELYLDGDKLLRRIETIGTVLKQKDNKEIEASVKHTGITFTKIKNKYYLVGSVNSSVLKSDIGNKIMTEYPLLNFSCVFTVSSCYDSTQMSLRSTDNNSDVSEIAKYYGGGGHRNASGCSIYNITNKIGTICGKKYIYDNIFNFWETKTKINGKIYNALYLNTDRWELAKYYLQDVQIVPFDGPIQEYQRLVYIKNKKLVDRISFIITFICSPSSTNGECIDTTKYEFHFDNSLDNDEICAIKTKFNVENNIATQDMSKCLFMLN